MNDPERSPERVTAHAKANEQLLYFTSSSLTEDDSHLIFISDRTGVPNLFARNLSTGGEVALSSNVDGSLRSYVYFDGMPYSGLGKASVSLDPASQRVFFVQGRDVRMSTLDGTERTIAELPAGQLTGFTHPSNGGTFVCVPTVDERALEGAHEHSRRPDYDIDARVKTERLSSYLRVFEADTGREVLREEVPRAWITHVQFSPATRHEILYNHEWSQHPGVERIWLCTGGRHRRLRDEGDDRSADDWVSHETWTPDGSAVVYHGRLESGTAFIARVQPDGSNRREIPLPAGWRRYGHFSAVDGSTLVSDGYFEHPDDPDAGYGAWICRVDVDWDAGSAGWTALCRSNSSWSTQDAHPHPVTDHAGRYVYFTSDRDGPRAVYRAPLRP